MYKAKELRDQTLQELEVSYQECCRKLYELNHAFKFQKKTENPHERKNARKDIARLLTVMTEKRNQKDQSR